MGGNVLKYWVTMSRLKQLLFLVGSVFLVWGGIWYLRSLGGEGISVPQFIVAEHDPEISADAWLLFDMETGEIIKDHNASKKVPIASVTKLMTAEVAVTSLDLDATTTVSWSAIQTDGRAGRLRAGERIQTRELLFPLLLESSNDAAEEIAEQYKKNGSLSGAMTREARNLGMHESSFADASGLADGNTSTAVDLSILLRHLFNKQRYLLDITTLPQYVGKEHDWLNNNPVHDEWGYLGGKHGYTEEAGRTFAGVFLEHLKGGDKREIGMVLLHSDDIRSDVRTLRTYLREEVAYAVAL